MANQLSEDYFEGKDTDEERMQVLVDHGYIDRIIMPLSRNAEIYWDDSNEFWLYSLSETASGTQSNYSFKNFDLSNFNQTGSWSSTDNFIKSGSGLLFIDNPRSEYTITTTGKIEPGSYGGFGVLFDTSVLGTSDTGYIVQFDRGYGRGSVVIRPRTNGSEGNVIQSHRFDYSNSFIPDKNTTEGEAWWNEARTLTLEVNVIEDVPLTKSLSVYIDGQLLFDDFIFQSNVSPANNFTGFRTWIGVEVEFYSLNIN